MLKKSLSILLAMLICLSVIAVMPVCASAEPVVEEAPSLDEDITVDETENASETPAEAVPEDEEDAESIPEKTAEPDLTDVGASAELAETGARYTAWSSWSTAYVQATATRQVESRQVVASYDIEGNCCGNSSGQRCYLKYMQSGYTLRLHYPKWTISASELNRWERWAEGSYYTYATNVNGYIIGPGTAYIDPEQHIPYFIVATNYETQYRYRDRIYTSIADCTVILSQTSYTYDGSAKTPDVTVKYGATVLRKGTDYSVTYSNNVNVGTASVVVRGTGDYNGSVTKNFTIKKNSAYPLDAPAISKLQNTASGVKITIKKVSGAAKYRIMLKTSSGLTKLCDTTSLTYIYTGVKSGTKYTFTVRCLSADGKKYTSDYNKTGWAITYFAAPKIKTLQNTISGVKLTWGKVNKAPKYRVFLVTSSGLKKLADTTATSYTHKAAQSGKKYTYTVCCINADGTKGLSAYNTKGWAITFFAAPKFKSISYSASGHVLKWGKVNGAVMYCVLIKSGGKWTPLAYTTKCTYTYKKAKAGVTYTYSLRCVNKNKKAVSAYDTKGKSFRHLAAPKISKVERNTNYIRLQWNHIKGAVKYRLYYRTKSLTGSSSWSKWYQLSDITTNDYASYDYYYHYTAGGSTYQYRVRCISSSGTVLSGYSANSKSLRFCQAPKVYQGCVGSGYLRFYWYNVIGAYKYKIYIWENNNWKYLSTSFGDVYYYYTNNTYGTHRFAIKAVDQKGSDLSVIRHVTLEYHSYSGIHLYTY